MWIERATQRQVLCELYTVANDEYFELLTLYFHAITSTCPSRLFIHSHSFSLHGTPSTTRLHEPLEPNTVLVAFRVILLHCNFMLLL